jgi:tetratricopeptide (TPR) repeat protein
MGVVYRAYDSELAADVALKTLSGVSPNDLYHLKQEFRALADIRHPNLIDFYELFADEHVCFFTMELIAGLQLPGYLRARTSSGKMDESVFRDMARQLALAVTAVHARMKLHRDIKPSNVMVTNAGRLVLLDFGLAIALSSDGAKTEHGGFAGTMGYMAPEQVRGEEMTTAVDWYGVGVTLFEAASGRLPFDHPLKGLARDRGAPHVRHFVPGFPEDIDDLIADLLQVDASLRPNGSEVLRRLGVDSDGPAPSSTRAPRATTLTTFEGRQGELETLGGALEEVRQGTTSVIHVHGPSGIGKSELARRFVDRAAEAGAAVLRGRCHPQETVAFNALDGAIDDLSRLLGLRTWADMPMPDAQQAEALVRIFPVLGRVESIAERAWGADEGAGAEAFRQATRALKELLAEVGRRQPLVIWIDDAQWGDEGSGTLVGELLAEPNAPTLLLLVTYRSEDREVSPTLRALADVAGLASIDVPLAPLSEHETLALIERLLRDRGADSAEQRAHLARETHGLPFFIQELARYLATPVDDDRAVPSHVRLGDLIRARVERLDEAARRVLEVVSVAGGPLEQRVLFAVAGPGTKPRRTVAVLERECLVRTLAIEADRRSEVYHHRIRDEVLDGLTDARRRSYHRAIGDAMLTTDQPKLARVVEHYDAAGDMDAVRRYVVVAANDAATALAFDLAARLYRRAIAVGGTELDDVELHARLGEALANAGRSRPAGEAFGAAAAIAERNTGSGYRTAYLRRLAAAQFLKGGHRDEAEAALRTVLSALRLELPRSRREAMRKTVVSRVRLLLRGLAFERRAPDVPAPALDRLDILHILAVTVAWVDHTKAAWLGTRFLLEALDAGDASRVARALSTEVALWAPLAGAVSQRQVDRMLALLAQLGSDSRVELTVADRAGYYLCRGIVASCRGRFAEACADLTRARDMASAVPYGIAFELANCEIFRLPVLAALGRLRELRVDLEAALRTADDRGDDFLVSMCGAGEPSLAWLAADQPDEATRWAGRALRLAAPGYSSDSYSTQHYLHLFTSVSVDLYRGRGLPACERMETAWPQLKANYFLTLRWVREQLLFLRARAAIAAALAVERGERSPRVGLGAERWLLLALEQAKKIERHRLPFAPPMADLIRAGVAGVRRQQAKARSHLERAATAFGAQEMHLYEHIARYCLEDPATPPSSAPSSARSADGSTPSSREGSPQGCAWLLAQGVKRPAALAHLLAPGCLPQE